jgi:hypothetical protein
VMLIDIPAFEDRNLRHYYTYHALGCRLHYTRRFVVFVHCRNLGT